MDLVDSVVIKKRNLKKVKQFVLKSNEKFDFIADEIVLIPSRKHTDLSLFRNIDLVVFKDNEAVVRLICDESDIINIKADEELSVDYLTKCKQFRLFPSYNEQLKVCWDGVRITIGVV